MNKRRRLGQHFLKSKKIAQLIVDLAHLTQNDTVLEIGTGKGILTELLCKNARNVISAESDKKLYHNALIMMGNIDNLQLYHGDGFKTKSKFDVFVSNLPYSKSRTAIEWLVQQNFSRAIIMLQKEFVQKLTNNYPNERKAITVLANHSFDIKKIINVGKNNFEPSPKVDSVVLELVKKKTLSETVVKTVNMIFSFRRKTLQNILKQFDQKTNDRKRLNDLTGDEIIEFANKILK